MKKIKAFLGWLRSCITPGYVTMLVAAFVLWYITKLGADYTTDHIVTIVVENCEYEVPCTIRGKGTDLIGYTIKTRRNPFEISMDELTFDSDTTDEDGTMRRHVSAVALQQVLVSRMNDVELIAVGIAPTIVIKPQTSLEEESQE